jgi:hypothetical protein
LLPISCNFKPRVLLDLARLQGDLGDVKAGIFFCLNGNQLGCIESLGHGPQGVGQGSLDRARLCQPKTFSGAEIVNRHEVPALLANHGLKKRRVDLFYTSPMFTDWLRKGIQRFRKIALLAQENGVRRHAFALFGTGGASAWKEPGKGRPGAGDELDDECSATKSAANSDGVAFITLGSASEKPVASGWLSGVHK